MSMQFSPSAIEIGLDALCVDAVVAAANIGRDSKTRQPSAELIFTAMSERMTDHPEINAEIMLASFLVALDDAKSLEDVRTRIFESMAVAADGCLN